MLSTNIHVHANTEYPIACYIPRENFPPLMTQCDNPEMIAFISNTILLNVNSNDNISDIASDSRICIIRHPDNTNTTLASFLAKGGYYCYQIIDKNNNLIVTGPIIEGVQSALAEEMKKRRSDSSFFKQLEMENKSDSATILELSNSVTLLKNKWLEIDSIYDAISKETQRIWWRLEDDLKENQRKWAAKEELYEENQRKWDLFRKSMIEALSNF